MTDNKYQRSKKTKQDILNITKRSLDDFGERQTIKYMDGLNEAMQGLSDCPDKGREFVHSKTRRVYLYHRYVSHVVYYRKRKNDIFIIRILHTKMLPEKHL